MRRTWWLALAAVVSGVAVVVGMVLVSGLGAAGEGDTSPPANGADAGAGEKAGVTADDGMSREARETMEQGPQIHLKCLECAKVIDKVRVRDGDTQWPKACPACGSKSAYRCKLCPYCGKHSVQRPDEEGRIYCEHCKKLHQDPSEAKYKDL